MYTKTANAMINNAVIVLDFLEPIDGFVKKPAANQQG